MKFTVAIDGPAAAGKGTISKAVAAHFGFAHLDTGLLYRAVGARVAEGEDPVSAARTLKGDDLARSDLRTQAVADAASTVATNQQVRQALVEFQRGFAANEGGAVLDGRDIGTVICPDADAKLFVTARAEVRAERRWKELQAAGMEAEFDTVLAEVEARDARDAGRKDAPMRQAADAVLLDTSDLTIDEAIARAVAAIETAGGRAGG
ncbi:MAG: (d)CMP kinase [Marivivens sp.]|nr:(d)CMP kinase [Marivivens sp.]